MLDGFGVSGDAVASMHDLMAGFASIGATADGGVARLAASAEDGRARDFLCQWFRGHDFEVKVDEVGNIFGYLDLCEGAESGAIYCGSHLDSQPNGGHFDGTYGVIAACCAALAIRELIELGALSPRCRYLVVAAWTNEEGARFQPSLLGSSVFSGQVPLERALAATDSEGIPLGQALSEIGYLGDDAPPAGPDWYVEIHVEQGSVLECARIQIGIVTHCWGARKLQLRFLGNADHTGPTPMVRRRDALRAASLLIADISERALASDGHLHGSVGRIVVEPNSPNVVPRSATLWVEFRAGDERDLDAAEAWLGGAVEDIYQATGCRGEIEVSARRKVRSFDSQGLEIVRTALDSIGLSALPMATISGHDAVALQKRCPSILLFVPSVGGVSHSPLEFTKDQDLEAGLQALIAVLSRLVSGAIGGTRREPEEEHESDR